MIYVLIITVCRGRRQMEKGFDFVNLNILGSFIPS